MSLVNQIKENLNSALKQKRDLEVSVLRQILAAVLNAEKDKMFRLGKEEMVDLTEEEIISILSSEAKKRRESIMEFSKGGRQDLVEKENEELEIIKKYLPEQMSEKELQKIIEEAIKDTGAKEIKDMGKVMAALMPKVRGRADGSLVSKIVKELLTDK